MYQLESNLQYWHSKLNKELFNNELEVAKIVIKDSEIAKEEGIEAEFIEWYSRPYIAFYSWSIEDDASVSIHEITVLLHEMIHQYCRQEGIVDMDSNGEHNSTFSAVAEKHGLNRYGYQLQSQLEDEIDAELDWFRNWEY